MKKLMIVAAVAALVSAVKAATLTPIDCVEDPEPGSCDIQVFKLTASGKTVQDIETSSASYKAVSNLKVTKGALAFFFDEGCAEEGACCYTEAALFATLKNGKVTRKVAVEGLEIGKWSIFGKNFEAKVRDYLHDMKKGSSTKVESDLFISGEDLEVVDYEEDAIDEISIWASAFGQMTAKLSKGKAGNDAYCDPEDDPGCVLSFVPGTYKGWFVGQRVLLSDGWCFNCQCGEYDIFGGTWTAVFQAKYNTVDGAQRVAFGKVLFGDEDDED